MQIQYAFTCHIIQGMKDYVKFISSLILFGSNGVMAAQILLPSCDIVVLRTLIGSVFLGVIFLIRRPDARFGSTRNAALVIASGISMGLSWLFLYEAYQSVGVAVSSLAYYCAPIMVMALSPLLFIERLTQRTVLSFAVVLAGALLLNAGALTGENASAWGLLCGWVSAVCHAAMVIFSKMADKVDGLVSSLVQLIASFAVAAVFLASTQKLPFEVPVASWPWVVVLGVVNTGLGCYLYFSSFEGLRAQTVAILGYLEPLSAVICALAFLGEPMSSLEMIGGMLIISGAVAGSIPNSSVR